MTIYYLLAFASAILTVYYIYKIDMLYRLKHKIINQLKHTNYFEISNHKISYDEKHDISDNTFMNNIEIMFDNGNHNLNEYTNHQIYSFNYLYFHHKKDVNRNKKYVFFPSKNYKYETTKKALDQTLEMFYSDYDHEIVMTELKLNPKINLNTIVNIHHGHTIRPYIWKVNSVNYTSDSKNHLANMLVMGKVYKYMMLCLVNYILLIVFSYKTKHF